MKMEPAVEILGMLKKGNVKHVKAASDALQKENIEVEKKLSTLKEKMEKEREERERMGGPRWKSSQKFDKTQQKSKISKRNIKILSDRPIEHYKKEIKPPPPDSNQKTCGQCDDRKAKVACNECAELYCADCYKQFHSRGALRKHTWKSLEQSSLKTRLKQQMTKISCDSAPVKIDVGSMSSTSKGDSNISTSDYSKRKDMISVNGYSVSSKSPPHHVYIPNSLPVPIQQDEKMPNSVSLSANGSGSSLSTNLEGSVCSPYNQNKTLLDGEFNEDESYASFSQALNEWRRAGVSSRQKLAVKESSATSTQGTSTQGNCEVKIDFSSSPALSYLDRIVVKKYKNNPQVLITAKYKSPPREVPAVNMSRVSTSPMDDSSSTMSKPAPCILSVHYSTTKATSTEPSTTIEIHPFEDGGEEMLEEGTNPIISYSSDCDMGNHFSSGNNDVVTAEVTSVTPLSEKPSSKEKLLDIDGPPGIKTDRIALSHTSDVRSIDLDEKHGEKINSTEMKLLEHKASVGRRQWKPPAIYSSMEKYFLLGYHKEHNTSNFSRDSGLIDEFSLSNDQELSVDYPSYWQPNTSVSKLDWNLCNLGTPPNAAHSSECVRLPSESLNENYLADSIEDPPINEDLKAVLPPTNVDYFEREYSNEREDGASVGNYLNDALDGDNFPHKDFKIESEYAFVTPATPCFSPSPPATSNYDFIQALPPQPKGDNYDKIHRSSTSLTISALPVDVWADSDISQPESRRSSNLCPIVRRKVSNNIATMHEQINECDNESLDLKFQKFNMLAEEVIARQSERDHFATHEEYENPSKCRLHREADSLSIEDNDAGSGLTTPESDPYF